MTSTWPKTEVLSVTPPSPPREKRCTAYEAPPRTAVKSSSLYAAPPESALPHERLRPTETPAGEMRLVSVVAVYASASVSVRRSLARHMPSRLKFCVLNALSPVGWRRQSSAVQL